MTKKEREKIAGGVSCASCVPKTLDEAVSISPERLDQTKESLLVPWNRMFLFAWEKYGYKEAMRLFHQVHSWIEGENLISKLK